jgi:hypothetical protein
VNGAPTKAEAAFAKWLNEGPRLAKAAGLYVGIKVMSDDHPEAKKAREGAGIVTPSKAPGLTVGVTGS